MQALGELAERDVERIADASLLPLLWFADVERDGVAGFEQWVRFARVDLALHVRLFSLVRVMS